MRSSMTVPTAVLVAVILLGPAYHAASPPAFVNYQGVLRDAADKPLDGAYDMAFVFFSAMSGGNEILVDLHTAGDSQPVTVTGGLFSVTLGTGEVEDGSGPGYYTSLSDAFRDYGEVWMQVEVGGEVLDPRVRVVAAAYSLNADHIDGFDSVELINTTSASQTKAGPLVVSSREPGAYGLEVYGKEGAYFEDEDQSGQAWLANGNWGIGGYGDAGGGHFEDKNSSGYAHVGYGDYGIQAYGNIAGGTFENTYGGSFMHAGRENYGLRAYGNLAGGTFDDLDQSGHAAVAVGDRGIEASGDDMGGYFENNGWDSAELASGSYGVSGHGFAAGGHFTSSYPGADATAYLGYQLGGNEFYGVRAFGVSAAGYFQDTDSGTHCYVGIGTASTEGNGAKHFVQNHPYREDRVIVYTSLEGDEAGTYTRGTARLIDGEARVSLGETFAWVTNPDIGLTVHLTPVGEWSELYVAERSTDEIVVRSNGGAGNAVFDYIVHGLRIGFEESSTVREKTTESFIPSMRDDRERYEMQPELRRFNALERFKRMAGEAEGIDDVDLSRAAELRETIQEYDPAVHGPVDRLLGHGPPREEE